MSRPAPSRAGTRALASGLLIVVLVSLVACRPLYLPPVPQDVPPEPTVTRVAAGSSLTLNAAGRPALDLVVVDLQGPGWLAVQWFAPGGKEAASESSWTDDTQAEVEFVLPTDVAVTPGEWRAVVSFGGVLLRQFTLVVDA